MADHATRNTANTASTSTAAATEKKRRRSPCGKGRKKVEIKKIQDKVSQVVTFSKRRNGLYRKTHDLCSLSGAEAAVISFSPAGKPYAFGSPSVISVLDRYVKETALRDHHHHHQDHSLPAKASSSSSKGKDKIEEEEQQEEEEEEEEEEGFLWDDRSIEEMGLEELKQRKAALEKLRVGLVMDLKKTSSNP